MKNLILPAFVMLIGAGTAFASGLAKKSDSKLVPINGYIFNQSTGQCENKGQCDTAGTEACTLGNVDPVANPLTPRLRDETCNTILRQVPPQP